MKRKRVLSIMMAQSLVMACLAGCGGGTAGDDAAATPPAEENEATAAEGEDGAASTEAEESKDDQGAAQEDVDPFGKYEDGLEIHFARQVDENMYDNALANLPGQSVEENIWLDTYKEEIGVQVVYDWYVKGAPEYEQKVSATIASGELPDVMDVTAAQMMQLADAGLIWDMSEIYDTYAADFTKEVMMQEGDTAFVAAQKNGMLCGIPESGGASDSVDLLWIRQDWLDNLGLEQPKNIDELINVIEKFTTDDPDGNGVDDTYGLGVAGSPNVLRRNYGSLVGFFDAFGAHPTIWVEKDGKLVYGGIQPECKEALAKLQELYKKGYIDPEFGVMDPSKAGEAAAAGKCGVTYGQQWLPLVYFHSNYTLDSNAQWTAFEPVSVSGDPVEASAEVGVSRWIVVNKDFEHPEAVVKMSNVFIEKCWGETGDNGKYYAPPDAESIWKLSPVQTQMPLKNVMAFRDIEKAKAADATDSLNGEAKSIWDKLDRYYSGEGTSMEWGWERIYGPDPSSYSAIDRMISEDRIYINRFSGAPTETMTEKMSTLESMRDEAFTKIIMGDSSIDEFDAFVENFNKLGGEQITAEVNEWYASAQ